MSSPNFQLIRDALDTYVEQMKINIKDNPFAEEVKRCDSPSAVLELLEKSKNEFKEYRDKNRKFIDCLNPVVTFVHAFSEILGEATSLIPFQPAKLVFVGINTLFSAAEKVSASYDDLLELFERIGSFLKRLDIYTKLSLSPLMTEIITKIMVELLSILAQAKKSQGRIKQFAKKLLGDSEIANILRRLDQLIKDEAGMRGAHILEVVHGLMNNMKVVMDGGEASIIEIRRTLVTIQDAVNGINKMNRDRLQGESRGWLSPPNPSENQVVARRDISDESAVWFIRGNTFEDWNAKGCLLWIHGKPGSGKSVLCSAIINEVMALSDAGLGLAAYYYFDFRNTATQDVRGLLSSLLVQLCARSDSCYEVLSSLYSTHDNGLRLPDDKTLAKCLRDMLELPEQPTIYLVVDALDECPSTSGLVPPRDRVLKLVQDLVGSHRSNLRICVTSRSEHDILEAIELLASHTVSLHDEDGQKQDIIDYVASVVQSDSKMQKWSSKNKRLVIDTISKEADGMFQWVICQLGALRHRAQGKIARALKELPTTLDETYERILQDIGEDYQKYAHCLFQCLCVSFRPLRLAELADVLAVLFDTGGDSEDQIDWSSEDEQKALLSACSSLISVGSVDGSPIVQFAHFTVREFLTSDHLANAGERLSRYRIIPHSAHTTLARASLNILLSIDGQVDKSAVEQRPLAIYAARHWVDHAKFEGVLSSIQDLMEGLFDRERPYFATWVWIYDFDSPWKEPTVRPTQPEASPLYYAALCGFTSIVERLAVTHPGDVNARGGYHTTPLNAALIKRDLDVARALLERGADVDAPDSRDMAPLHHASLAGNCDAVELLLSHQADVNIDTDDEIYLTPLSLAALCGRLEVCRLLVEHGADINPRDGAPESPLQAASSRGHSDVVKFLLDSGASLEFRNEKGKTALAKASRYGSVDVVRILIKSGADIASRDNNQSTPLSKASEYGHLDVVRDLLLKGADPSVQDSYNKTPLHLASTTGYLDVVQLLIQHGSIPDKTDRYEEAPLHLALRHGKLEVARFLIDHRANLTSKDKDGQTPLHHASRHGALDLIELLLKGGVDVNIRNADKKTPLHLASGDGKLDVACFLIERGADVNVEDAGLSSPLHDASANGHLEVAELLVERGAEVDKQGSSQETPLHRASGNGKLEVARFLIKCGSNVGSRDSEGWTSLHAAARWGHLEVVELLLELGADMNARDIKEEYAFDVASLNGKIKVARFLAERMGLAVPEAVSQDGPNIGQLSLEDGGGDTSDDGDEMTLHAASAQGRLTVVRSILDRGIDVDSRNARRQTALHVASEKGRLEVVRLLIDRGAGVNCRDKDGHTPLDASTFHPENLNIARLLLDRGAYVDTTCHQRSTPLHHASARGHPEIVQLLIERGANVNALSGLGLTPLEMARLDLSMEGINPKVIQLLRGHGAR